MRYHSVTRRPLQSAPRTALTVLESLVALSLLGVALSVAAQFSVRHNHLLTDLRTHRLAIEQLTDELDRLARLPSDERAAAVEKLNDSDSRVTAALQPEATGVRIVVAYEWPAAEHTKPRLSLTGWAYDAQSEAGETE